MKEFVRRIWERVQALGRVDLVEPPPASAPLGAKYTALTTKFDLEIRSEVLAADPDKFITRSRWDEEDFSAAELGIVAAADRDVRVSMQALAVKLKSEIDSEALHDTVVALLIDHSGSMRRIPMRCVASAAEALSDALVPLGVGVEVLGFTTRAWKGGESRKEWLRAGRPYLPGRLNDLLHIIYRSASDPMPASGHAFAPMRETWVLKENIDGEALRWARDRLAKLPQMKRVLIVLSDGAPVDDSTLAANWPRILMDDARETIAQIEQGGSIALGAIGIEYDVNQMYGTSAVANPAYELAQVFAPFVEKMLRRVTALKAAAKGWRSQWNS
jgi:cobaltochelatase CobT